MAWSALLQLALFVVAVSSELNVSNEHVNIWIIPHTHDDTGWLKTVDEYYVEQVHWILETVTEALLENPERKFTYVEMAYFYRWWNEINDEMKSKVMQVIQNGQLQLNLAGWCMNDEATTHYAGIINQMTEGALFAVEQLKNRSTVGWHVDTFGHSSATPSLWADVGFNAFGINRIDFRDLVVRKIHKKLEFVWRGSKTLGQSRDMWTHILDSNYCSPPECAYDNNLYLQNDPNLPSYPPNIEEQAKNFVIMARERVQWYRHNHILIPFGCDFAHENAEKSFIQMDELMEYVNSKSGYSVTVRYGTLDDYARAINSLGLTWDVYEGDFFPYVTSPHAYWTGFYTSRPLIKGYVRSMSAVLQVAETLYSLGSQVFSLPQQQYFDQIDILRKAVSVSEHHDAITGTERSYVAMDYREMMNSGKRATDPVITDILAKLVGGNSALSNFTLNLHRLLANAHSGDKIAAVVYNSLAWNRQSYVSVAVTRHDLLVLDSDGQPVPSDILTIPSGTGFDTTLYFLANLPPFGFRVYYIDVGHKYTTQSVNFSAITGRMTSILNKQTKKTLRLDQNLAQYVSASTHGEQASGAYVFRPALDNNTLIIHQKNSRMISHKKKFYETFSEPPVVIMTAIPQEFGLFPLSSGMVKGNEVVMTTYRLDKGHWLGSVRVAFWAAHPKKPPVGSQVGSWMIGHSLAKCKVFTGKFSKHFNLRPHVVATVRMNKSADEVYIVSAINVSVQGASFNVCRADGSSWTQQLFVDWFAFEQNVSYPSGVVHGSAVLSGGSTEQSKMYTIMLKGNMQVRNGAVLALVTSGSHAFVVNTYYISEDIWVDAFDLLIANVDLTPWTEDIRVDWVLFERWTMQLPVSEDPVTVHVAVGSYVSVIKQDFKHGYAQIFRVFGNPHGNGSSPDQQYVEGEFQLGPIDEGREVITRFVTDLHTSGVWYADSNGLDIKKRIYDDKQFEKVAGNYYPMVSTSYIQDSYSGDRLTLLSDRAHGCSSLFYGELEVMMHRRCLMDDGLGLGQVLDDTSEIQAKLWIIYAGDKDSSYLQRRLALLLENPVAVAYASISSLSFWSSQNREYFSGLKKELPLNIHLLSLRAVSPKKHDLILRLEHMFEADEHPKYSNPVNISLSNLFASNFSAANPVEMSLTANIEKSIALREQLKWKTLESGDSNDNLMVADAEDGVITLSPREIRTFIINGS